VPTNSNIKTSDRMIPPLTNEPAKSSQHFFIPNPPPLDYRTGMKLLTICTLMVALLVAGGEARADRWDSKGWVKLGERSVNGRVDRDRIDVGRNEGSFTKLSLVVENSDLELLEFDVTFGNGDHWNPRVRHTFRENSRARVIDLPGDKRIIKSIELKYRNLPGGGNARVEVWGWKPNNGGGGPDRRPAAFSWDSRGWQLLGERDVNGRVDRDRISVGRYKGRFSKLTLVVLDSDLELLDFDVKFNRGQPWNPRLSHYFREGARTRVIDVPGDERVIQYIDLKYRNLPGGGRAKVQVWGK
jgi:hypothetical protein